MNENHKKSSAVHKIKLEPHFLVEVFRVASEARNHLNEFLSNDDSDDVEISREVIDFFVDLISNHPDEEVRRWFVNELRGEHEHNP